MSIGDRVRRARKKAGLTQKELGDAVGVKQATISGLEKGDSRSSAYLVQIARVCGVNADWLATGNGEEIMKLNDTLRKVEQGRREAEIKLHPLQQRE